MIKIISKDTSETNMFSSLELSYREFMASFKNATPEERMKFIATFPSICNECGLSMTEDEQLFVALEML